MNAHFSPHHLARLLRVFTATCSVGAVLLLTALATRPDLHESVHDHAHEAEHSCAVDLFAQGVAPAVDTAVPQQATPLEVSGTLGAESHLLLAPTPALHPPGRGPPALTV